MKNGIKDFIENHKAFTAYGFISVLVTVIDIIVCRFCERFTTPVIANTVGVITGFIIQYFLTARHVYNTKSMKSFLVFFLTFLLNLAMANGIVYLFRTFLFDNSSSGTAFLISKAASIVFPFFITYFIRKKVMPSGRDNNE